MTPKEKARELVDKYAKVYYDLEYDYCDDRDKQCALIAIDEMFEEISKWAGGDFQEWEKERWKYLQEVKQEIEKL